MSEDLSPFLPHLCVIKIPHLNVRKRFDRVDFLDDLKFLGELSVGLLECQTEEFSILLRDLSHCETWSVKMASEKKRRKREGVEETKHGMRCESPPIFCFIFRSFSWTVLEFLCPSATCCTNTLISLSSCILLSAYLCICLAAWKHRHPRSATTYFC